MASLFQVKKINSEKTRKSEIYLNWLSQRKLFSECNDIKQCS